MPSSCSLQYIEQRVSESAGRRQYGGKSGLSRSTGERTKMFSVVIHQPSGSHDVLRHGGLIQASS
jgi:hypothetical protein